MIATLVIGLREGLEAALIVGIIAAFLKRNGRSLVAMWIGVVAAVLASLAVGIGLSLLEAALPQAAQEALETVIGAVAVVFVTGMLLWMNTHARSMKKDLEASAGEALHDGTAWALAAMAFLAVLKEGFETSVFLLATFQASTNTTEAAIGALIGVVIAVGIGVGIYAGGVKINLAKFFRFTSGFLVLVAAGLVLTAVRTAHEAGWLNAGQQRTVDLSWLAPAGSVQGALITGMLGIPADPRLVEVVAWFAYLVPTALVVFWPAKHRPTGRAALRLRWSIAGALGVAGLVLAVAVPAVPRAANATAPLVSATGARIGTARLDGDVLVTSVGGASTRSTLAGSGVTTVHDGVTATEWSVRLPAGTGPATLSLDALTAASGGRVPVGFGPSRDPGPFTAAWTGSSTRTVWAVDGVLLDTAQTSTSVVTLSGGGLATTRTLALDDPAVTAPAWHAASATVAKTASTVAAAAVLAPEHRFWSLEVPLILLAAALLVVGSALRGTRRTRAPRPSPAPTRTRSVPVAAK